MEEAIKKFLDIQKRNELGGGQEHIDRQHERGKLTARERIDVLIDPGTFEELGSCVNTTGTRLDGRRFDAPADGLILGTAEIHGRRAMIEASDFTVMGGSQGLQHRFKLGRGMEMAARWGLPVINLLDSSGGRLGYRDIEAAGLDWYFRIQSLISGLVPQITVLMGPCIAGGAYLPTLCDFLFMSRVSGYLWLGGPRQTQAATGEIYDDKIGGADYHMQDTGTCDVVGDDDTETILKCREMMRYLPQNCRQAPPRWNTTDPDDRPVDELAAIVPDDFNQTYDMHDVIEVLVDDGEFFEIKDEYAKNLICCFARFGGRVAGIAANNPKYPGGVLETDSCDKYYRFLQVLDAYNIPLVNLTDTPPVVPGQAEEARGLIRHMGKIVEVYATTTVPKIGVVVRQAYADAGSLIMGGLKGMGADLTYAWPIARFGVEASSLDYRQTSVKGIEADADEYWKFSREKVDVFEAARSWSAEVVDEIILPGATRRKIIQALQLTEERQESLPPRLKMHGSSPS
jgi:propionyl-CoA carboxylase beta chain